MPKESAKPPSAKSTAAQDMTALWAPNGDTLEAVVKANEALASGMAAWGQEVMTFANRRLAENMQRSESLFQCKDPEAAFRLGCDFAKTASEQYLEETDRFIKLAARISRDCWAPLEKRTQDALHETVKS